MTQIAIFPGTFDPITKGHEDLIARASGIFSEVIVAIAENAVKKPLFSLDQRISMSRKVLQQHKNVKVFGFSNLLVDFAREHKAEIIIRGVRIAADFEYELQLANMNRNLYEKLETIFLIPSENYSYISSTLVKEIAKLNGDVTHFVNADVAQSLQEIAWP